MLFLQVLLRGQQEWRQNAMSFGLCLKLIEPALVCEIDNKFSELRAMAD